MTGIMAYWRSYRKFRDEANRIAEHSSSQEEDMIAGEDTNSAMFTIIATTAIVSVTRQTCWIHVMTVPENTLP